MLAHACSRPTARPRYPSSLSASHRGELSGVKTVAPAPTIPRAQAIVEQSFYPTPPPSPDLIDVSVLPLERPTDEAAQTAVDPPTAQSSPAPAPAATATPIRIPLLLNTHHPLPHAATLRLDAPSGILAVLGGNRVLSLDAQTVWDRMPYSAVTAVVATRDAMEEDAVEMIIGGKRPERRGNGIHRGVTAVKDQEPVNSIFVHPPTPEREEINSRSPITSSSSSSSSSNVLPSEPLRSPGLDFLVHSASSSTSPSTISKPLPSNSSRTAGLPVPFAAIPEVRSPPRRTLAMAADSLQVAQRRGRRPRLFGFTELSESSGSSAGSSPANSRSNSPERTPEAARSPLSTSFSMSSPSMPSVPAPGAFIPRRTPVRARSATDLPTISTSIASSSSPPQHHPHHHHQPRRRENGLKLDFTGIIPVSPTPSESQSAVVHSPYPGKLIRKKSGEILKSALKYGGPLSANGTPLTTPVEGEKGSPRPRFESKSCPTTPSCPKYVHFDAQLERVKLFLHDQKPLVVSRDASPTAGDYTTSEGEEYPFPSTDEEKDVKKSLQIRLPNFPTSHAPDSQLYLESLFLDDERKHLKGVVLCKNLAFQKWVAVRFTVDWWQTTSEVSATYKESIKGGAFDRFSFSIRLADFSSRIEEKTLFLAIRYTTDGREIWDSNGGQNYQVIFEKVVSGPAGPRAARAVPTIQVGMGRSIGGRTSQWSDKGGHEADRMADLRARLSRLTADDRGDEPPQVSPIRDRYAFSPSKRDRGFGSPQGSPRRGFSAIDTKPSDLPTAGPALAARYDFGSAFKGARDVRRNSNSPNSSTTDLNAMRTGLLQFPNSPVRNPHAGTEFYSPRYSPSKLPEQLPVSDQFFSPTNSSTMFTSPSPVTPSSTFVTLPVPDLHVQGPSPPPEDGGATPTSPKRPSVLRSHTSPAVLRSKLPESSSAETSPPQLDMSGSVTDTPTESPKSPPDMTLPKWSPSSKSDSSDLSLASYSSFIEQFCWGGAAPPLDGRRSHSTSELDQYFAQPSGPSTPRGRPPSYHGQTTPGSSASGGTSYFSSYPSMASTPTAAREDLDQVEHAVRALGTSPARGLMGGGMPGNMSPPVIC